MVFAMLQLRHMERQFIRVEQENEPTKVHLLIAKSRVAPIKTVTIPRLELAAADLLAQLYELVQRAMDWKNVPYMLW